MCVLEEKHFGDAVYLNASQMGTKYGIDVFFTSRLGGSSKKPYDSLNLAFHVGDDQNAVKQNRQKVSTMFALDGHIYTLKQMHSSNIVALAYKNKHHVKNEAPEADALVTSLKRAPIMVLGADCGLVVLTDKAKRLIAVVHSGWKGTAQKIVAKVIDHMQQNFSCCPRDMAMYLGPSIRQCCYDIGQEVLDRFKAIDGTGHYYQKNNHRFFLDLPALLKKQALQKGILVQDIHDSHICTYCDGRFFSYRREKITGRHAAIAVLRS